MKTIGAISGAGATIIVPIVVLSIATPYNVDTAATRQELSIVLARTFPLRQCEGRVALGAVAGSCRCTHTAVRPTRNEVIKSIVVVAIWRVIDMNTGVVAGVQVRGGQVAAARVVRM